MEWQFYIKDIDSKMNLSEKNYFSYFKKVSFGLPWWLHGKESACRWRRHRFDSWSRKISHHMTQLQKPTHSRAHALQQEMLSQWETHILQARVTWFTAIREKPTRQWRTSTARNKFKKESELWRQLQ